MGQSKPVPAATALKRLKAGNKKYVADKLKYKGHNSKRRKELVCGQEPYAVVLSCADSRVVPELIFDAGLGDLFVVRVAGNVANTCSLASIEYAVGKLPVKPKLVVVLGHEGCGAVGAALTSKDTDLGHNLNSLLTHLKPAVVNPQGKTEKTQLRNAVKTNAKLTAKALVDRSPIIADEDPVIVPAYYHLKSGKVSFL